MQNMKVDIIYYTIQADFELEFNLNGCCPMRLLKTLACEKKEYIEALARAVSRSKVIIVCGPVYGETGLINLTAKAIRKPLVVVNNSEYGIAQDQNVRIIEGSVPLVSRSGLFGGIIIESGPQTIIILSENKDVRRSVMRDLIHPYVREVSILEIRRNSGASVLDRTPAESATENPGETEAPAFEDTSAEGIDFSKDENADETTPDTGAAPCDAALEAVAKELNELSGEIGRTLTANERGEESENGEAAPVISADEAPATDISDDDFYFEDKKESDYEIERGEDYYDENGTVPEEISEATPQIDFKIDPADDEKDGGKADSGYLKTKEGADPDADVPAFLFENPGEAQNAAADTPEPREEFSFIAESDEGDEHGDGEKDGNKKLNISIIIITAVLAVIAILLIYFLVYLPKAGGQSPLEYLKQLFGDVRISDRFLRGN